MVQQIKWNIKSNDNEHRTTTSEERSCDRSNNINNIHHTTDREGRNRCCTSNITILLYRYAVGEILLVVVVLIIIVLYQHQHQHQHRPIA